MSPASSVTLIAVTRGGLDRARRLRAGLGRGTVHFPERLGPTAHAWEYTFAGPLAEQVPPLFARGGQLVFFLAVGAVTRVIAPCLVSKDSDPGVLAVDEAGQFVVVLLSGHKGGANVFARTAAGLLGATPVITTASDLVAGFSPDLLEEAFGWTAEPRERLKAAALALVEQQPVAIVQEVGSRGAWLRDRELPANVTCTNDALSLAGSAWAFVLWITDRLPDELHGLDPERILWYRPRSLALGVGCERGLSPRALADGLERFLHTQRIARASIRTLASATLKADEEAILALAQQHGWETLFYAPDELARVEGIATPSAVVEKCVGTPGVAEPAALLAAGSEQLLANKQVVASPLAPQRMTFALARHADYRACRTRTGKVSFVGAGPGDPDLLTLRAARILRQADVVVYAGSLVPEEVLRHAPGTAVLHNSAPLTLEQVVELMVNSALSGQQVVRLHSGDTSLYSAIGEQIACLEEAGIDYEVHPGISSFQAVAAALGIELTVPERVQTVILTRGEGETKMPPGESLADLARHGAMLCIFLSARLGEAVQAELLTAYPPDTPVVLAYRVTWPDEKIIHTTLAQLSSEIRTQRLSRTTLILVGPALGTVRQRSRLYDRTHGHIFRARTRDETHPSA